MIFVTYRLDMFYRSVVSEKAFDLLEMANQILFKT